jgi:hypothetical protein
MHGPKQPPPKPLAITVPDSPEEQLTDLNAPLSRHDAKQKLRDLAIELSNPPTERSRHE